MSICSSCGNMMMVSLNKYAYLFQLWNYDDSVIEQIGIDICLFVSVVEL